MLIGADGPAVVVPARIAAILERQAGLSALRVRVRGVDPEATKVLEALRYAAMFWRSSATTGTSVAKRPEPAASSGEVVGCSAAAAALECTSRAIRKACDEGRMPATKTAAGWRISRDDLEHYRATRRRRS